MNIKPILDAVMSAQDRLILCSTGFDVRWGRGLTVDALSDSSMLLATSLALIPPGTPPATDVVGSKNSAPQ